MLSRTGRAVGVDADGRVVGVTSYDRLRAAIQGADEAGRAGPAAGSRPTGAGSRRARGSANDHELGIQQLASMLAHLLGQNACTWPWCRS